MPSDPGGAATPALTTLTTLTTLTATPALTARGARVHVRPVRAADAVPYQEAVAASRERVSRWNPVDPNQVPADLAGQSATQRTFMVVANDPAGGHGLVGRVNVASIVRGRFCSGTLGYDAYDPYAGQGMFREGLGLVVTIALRAEQDGGLGLHRVEANVQPTNVRSAGVLRALGFRHEGATPRMLYLDGPGGLRWRDHERYAVTAQEWPGTPYAVPDQARRVVLVNGPPGLGRSTLAHDLATELALPLLSGDGGWPVLARCPVGAVLESSWSRPERELVAQALRVAGVQPSTVVEVWCAGPASDEVWCAGPASDEVWCAGPASDEGRGPLGWGPVQRIDLAQQRGRRDVVRLALALRALLH